MSLAAAILFVVVFAVLATYVYGGLRAAPWVPTRARDMVRFLHLARITPGMRVVDLGCGNARMLATAVCAGAVGVGYEVSLLPYVLAKLRARLPRYGGRLTVRYRDFWRVSCADADLVYCFLMPSIYPKLKRKLEQELRPGARVMLYAWPMEGWNPAAVDRCDGRPAFYLYQR